MYVDKKIGRSEEILYEATTPIDSTNRTFLTVNWNFIDCEEDESTYFMCFNIFRLSEDTDEAAHKF